jgi:hypothetical protein
MTDELNFSVLNSNPGEPVRVTVVSPPQRLWNPGVAALMSFLIPGAGQIYKGQIFKGILYLLVVAVGYAAFVLPGVILHVLAILDAVQGDPFKDASKGTGWSGGWLALIVVLLLLMFSSCCLVSFWVGA